MNRPLRIEHIPGLALCAVLLVALVFVAAGCGGDGADPQTDTARAPESEAIDLSASSGVTGQSSPEPAGGTSAQGDENRGQETATEPPISESVALATQRASEGLPKVDFTFGEEGIDPGQILLPFDVAVDGEGNIHVSDSKGVQKFDSEGNFIHVVGEGEVAVAQGIDVAPDGTVYVAGLRDLVLVYDSDGNKVGQIGESGEAPGQTSQPVDVALDASGNIYIADTGNYRIEKFAPNGAHLLSFGERGTQNGQFTAPRVVTVDEQGRIYVGMGDDFLVQRFTPDGEYLDTFGHSHSEETMWRIAGLAIADDGEIIASRSIGHMLQDFDGESGGLNWEYGELGRMPGEFNTPGGLEVVGDRLYVADTSNNRVQVLILQPDQAE